MDPSVAIATGLILGVSSAGHCFWSCAAVLGPYMVTTDRAPLAQRWSTVGAAFRVLGWYNLGRLLAYLAAGLLASLVFQGTGGLPTNAQAVALLVTAGLLGLAVLRPASTTQRQRCWSGRRRTGAFVIGLLQGLSPCPPFLIAVGIALSSTRVASGLLLFLALFVGTALYTLPLAFLEPLRRRGWLLTLSRWVGGGVCVYLVLRAVVLLESV